MDDDGVATLAMPSWVTFNDHWDWRGFIDRAFAELAARRATTLVIDLRGNEGGTSVGDAILAHLTDHEIVPTQLRRYNQMHICAAVVAYRDVQSDRRALIRS